MKIILASVIAEYLDFYYRFAAKQWANMTPTKYGILLISIGLVGWLMMKSNNKST